MCNLVKSCTSGFGSCQNVFIKYGIWECAHTSTQIPRVRFRACLGVPEVLTSTEGGSTEQEQRVPRLKPRVVLKRISPHWSVEAGHARELLISPRIAHGYALQTRLFLVDAVVVGPWDHHPQVVHSRQCPWSPLLFATGSPRQSPLQRSSASHASGRLRCCCC